jgi:hypothetical protein
MKNEKGNEPSMQSHLAVMQREPLRRLLAGEKRIESRLSKVHCAPHDCVEPGDRIFFKAVGGPVRATALAASVATWRLSGPDQVASLRSLYNSLIVADNSFWAVKRDARWATLIVLKEVCRIVPLHVPKRDRRPWMVLSEEPSYRVLQRI